MQCWRNGMVILKYDMAKIGYNIHQTKPDAHDTGSNV